LSPGLKAWARRSISRTLGVGGTITHVDTREPIVALTFDDGPDPEWTPQMLEVLARHDARATFFMIGKLAARHPDLVRRVAEAGHTVANHSWDHTPFPLLRGRLRRAQLRWCQDALAPHGEQLFRPPHGQQSPGSFLDARRLGYGVVTWNLVAEDFRGDGADAIESRMSARLAPGSIVLLHDSLYVAQEERFRDRTATLAAVDRLLARCRDEYEFTTVPDLLARGRARRWPWFNRVYLPAPQPWP
jgi:peptidoglycan/xylan/chitin deacetylase (PgdA/CDA1 family)